MGDVLILNEREVVELLDMPGCIEAMTSARYSGLGRWIDISANIAPP